MGFKITLDGNFTGEHMGLVFMQGTAHTEDAFLASRLQSKGYMVAADESVDDETVPDSGEAPPDIDKMNLAQLKEFAESKHIDLGGAKTKFEVVAAINAAIADTE